MADPIEGPKKHRDPWDPPRVEGVTPDVIGALNTLSVMSAELRELHGRINDGEYSIAKISGRIELARLVRAQIARAEDAIAALKGDK